MMVIFHVCYHNLHASISQITDVTGATCRASLLMKMLVAFVTPGNARIPVIDWVIATLRRRWKCPHQRINTPQWIIKQTVWARAEIHLLHCFLPRYFCFIRQKQDPDFQFHWRINIFSFYRTGTESLSGELTERSYVTEGKGGGCRWRRGENRSGPERRTLHNQS